MHPVRTAFAVFVLGVAVSLAAACDTFRPAHTLEDLARRPLTTEVRPWYVFHGLLAYGQTVRLEDSASKSVPAVDFVTSQRFGVDDDGKPLGLIFVEDGLPQFTRTPREYFSQGHANQFLSILVGMGVPLSQRVDLGNGETFTLADMLEKAKRDIRPALLALPDAQADFRERELGWSIPLFANTLGTDASWTNKYGEDVSVASLVEIALKRPVGWGSCAGTHELYGLADALKTYRSTHDELTGVWARLAQYLSDAKLRARVAQEPDGWFDFEWSHPQAEQKQNGESSDNRKVYVTGHMLDWLVLVSTPEELEEPLVRNSYLFLERSRFKSVRFERGGVPTGVVGYGALAHAVHAMRLYDEALRARGTAAQPVGIKPTFARLRSSRSYADDRLDQHAGQAG